MSEGDRAPTQVRIEILINIDGLTLAVTYTPGLAYRFQVMCPPDDDIYQDENLYYTPAAAEQAGRRWIQRVFG